MLADFYGPQQLLREGRLPPELVFEHPGFLRPCSGVPLPGGTLSTVMRSTSRALRTAAGGCWPIVPRRHRARATRWRTAWSRGAFCRTCFARKTCSAWRRSSSRIATCCAAWRRKRENPRIVVLTPGPYNETYFEHAFLARYLGYTLVEGGDLTVRNNHVYLKTLGGLLPVDVIVRRQDDTYCDPLELRGDSMLGVAGWCRPCGRQRRGGQCAGIRTAGIGRPAAFLPVLCKHMLGEELRMPNIATWWCGDDGPREWVARPSGRTW